MSKLIKATVTKHQRGFFGRVWQIAFWLFQLTMIGLVYANFFIVGEVIDVSSEFYDDASAALFGGTAAVVIGAMSAVLGWFVWFLGRFILGLLMFATGGKLVAYDVEK